MKEPCWPSWSIKRRRMWSCGPQPKIYKEKVERTEVQQVIVLYKNKCVLLPRDPSYHYLLLGSLLPSKPDSVLSSLPASLPWSNPSWNLSVYLSWCVPRHPSLHSIPWLVPKQPSCLATLIRSNPSWNLSVYLSWCVPRHPSLHSIPWLVPSSLLTFIACFVHGSLAFLPTQPVLFPDILLPILPDLFYTAFHPTYPDLIH